MGKGGVLSIGTDQKHCTERFEKRRFRRTRYCNAHCGSRHLIIINLENFMKKKKNIRFNRNRK